MVIRTCRLTRSCAFSESLTLHLFASFLWCMREKLSSFSLVCSTPFSVFFSGFSSNGLGKIHCKDRHEKKVRLI